MRVVIVGAGAVAVVAARLLVERGNEVVMIERNEELIEELSENLDCGFVHGDGSKPADLREAGVGDGDTLFCLTDDDQTNILAALVGRSLGVGHIVVKVEDAELESLCGELGLDDVIVPDRTTGQALADLAVGGLGADPASVVKHHARFFSFTWREAARPLAELELPEEARVVCLYRGGKLLLPKDDTELADGDEVVMIAHARHLETLAERWGEAGGPT